jgi:hypothetical protein
MISVVSVERKVLVDDFELSAREKTIARKGVRYVQSTQSVGRMEAAAAEAWCLYPPFLASLVNSNTLCDYDSSMDNYGQDITFPYLCLTHRR